MSISIITPVHGQKEDYYELISQTAKHLKKQDFLPKEWIVVCDEKSKWIYDMTLPEFTKILTAKENNIAIKRNIALDKASAEYILFLDSDQFPENSKMLNECISKSNQGYEILLIPEKFSNKGSYLKRSYHHLRQLYWTNSKQGIPRFFKKNQIGEKRYQKHMLHFEDRQFYNSIRNNAKEEKTENYLIHDEMFSIYSNLRKIRIAHKQEKKHKIEEKFRLKLTQIVTQTPISLLPGVIFLLITRTIAKRVLPIQDKTSR